MTGRIVIITGSRVLSGKAGLPWRLVEERLLPEDVIVTGDASGIDKSARGIASDNRIKSYVYALDGAVYEKEPLKDAAVFRRWVSSSNLDKIPRRDVPLARNTAMIAACARSASVICLAVEAAWSHTKGTKHTYQLAQRFGIDVFLSKATKANGSEFPNFGEFEKL